MWVMAAAIVAFAITLNLNVYFVAVAASFVVYAICLAIIRRRKK